MSKLPRVAGKDVLSALSKAGFEVLRIRGSHYILRHSDGRRTVAPVHAKENIGPGLLNKILRDCELSRDEFISLM
ncbi:MAG: type II toxin-antitoxin system HicA family toxin [Phycisphaerae bacterium]|nr:type II toxin-antitoxin system HicA family toxin [Phycisphaerae bacterium]